MILNRMVELQAHSVLRQLTDDQEEYEFIESLIESQKPESPNNAYHYLISTPFRYPLPIPERYQGRFKPPLHRKNCFYGAEHFQTCGYEYAYHWLRQRVHASGLSQEPQQRTHFKVSFNDPDLIDVRDRADINLLMDRNDYNPSHRFVLTCSKLSSILYPSCRDLDRGNCVAIFEMRTLGKSPLEERNLELIYQSHQRTCTIQDPVSQQVLLNIAWTAVC